MDTPFLIFLFFITALIYSLVGFGGGSTYLALLILFHFPFETIPKIALVCNIVVVLGGVIQFAKGGHLKIKKILPFVLLSIPFSYLGGAMVIDKTLFLILLGLSLAAAGLRLLFFHDAKRCGTILQRKGEAAIGFLTGGVLGFLSGLVGIGGGIFLAPLLYFLKWGNPKEIAAASSFFIFVNSISGLLGQFSKKGEGLDFLTLIPFVLAVFLGGQIGSRLGAEKISFLKLQQLTASLILYVSFRIFWGLL